MGCSKAATASIPMHGCDVDSLVPKIIGNIENPIVMDYITNVEYDDNDYTYTKVLEYCSIPTDWDKTHPSPINVTIDESVVQKLNNDEIDSLIIYVYDDDCQLVRRDVYELGYEVPIYNLIPDQEYYYTVSYNGVDGYNYFIDDGYLEVEGRFRAIRVEGMHNFRDIGGYKTIYGKRIKYDKLFRSAELLRKANLSQGNITKKGVDEIVNNLKIDIELDFGDENTESPLQGIIEFINDRDYKITSYDIALDTESLGFTGDHIKNCFELLLEKLKQDKKVLFHCNAGADRTGTLAFILEALLGVSESDLAKDYEITSFFQGHTRRRDMDSKPDRGSGYPAMISYIKTHFEGNNINEKVEKMMLSFSITQDQIKEFRQIMLEEYNGAPSKIDIHNDKSIMPASMYNMQGLRLLQQQNRGMIYYNGRKLYFH